MFRLFQNYNKIFEIIKVGTHGNLSLGPIVHQKSHILVINDNTYMANQRMKVYFVNFFLHSKFLVICN